MLFHSLKTVTGSLGIFANDALPSIDGFQILANVSDTIFLTGNLGSYVYFLPIQ
jgi:hypothetical protein